MKLCFRNGAELTSLKTAYDEREAKVAPGFLLSEDLIEHCCNDPSVQRLNLVSHASGHQGFRPNVVPAHAAYISLHNFAGPFWVLLLGLRQRHGSRLGHLWRRLRGRAQ